ncbi:MAG TPA: ABC transporter substrate-binding protein [Xanthobacteraceae bacterium]|jgi:putative ABC transport system substrate-binding protein|nr:ABC transporter substrate-binding protein [Xanthobacteraceae bacterium]
MTIDFGRRKLIAGLGGAALWPLTAHAAGGRPRIGFLDINSAESDALHLAAFRNALQRLGYFEGRTVDIDYRYADGDTEKLTALAQELVQLKPDVVLASAVSPTRAMKRIAPALPIVCPAFSDSFVPSLAASLAHPGGSVTGIASDVEGMFGKLTEVTLDAIPGTTKIGFLSNPAGGSMKRFEQQVQSASNARGVEVQIEEVKKIDDFDGAFQRLSQGNVRAVIVPANGLLNSGQKRILELSLPLRLPLIFADRSGVDAGGLASYGVNISENFSRAAIYVDKILKGTAPGDLPIEFPTRLELVINLKTAKALGLTVPPALLSRADEAIE